MSPSPEREVRLSPPALPGTTLQLEACVKNAWKVTSQLCFLKSILLSMSFSLLIKLGQLHRQSRLPPADGCLLPLGLPPLSQVRLQDPGTGGLWWEPRVATVEPRASSDTPSTPHPPLGKSSSSTENQGRCGLSKLTPSSPHPPATGEPLQTTATRPGWRAGLGALRVLKSTESLGNRTFPRGSP